MSFNEKFIYHIWDAQHINRPLSTVNNSPVEILFQGRWNTDSGPDFKGAIIKIGQEILRGDVEIHIKTYDWINHHHHEDPAFNNVILHVVYQHNGTYSKTINEEGGEIEILQLCDQLTEDISKLLTIYKDEEFSEHDKFCKSFGNMSDVAFDYVLVQMGKMRLENKKKRFNAELSIVDFNQLLYQGIMEAAGYSKNKFQMLNLAVQLSYAQLKSYFFRDMTKEQMLAILLCSSGLIDKAPKNISRIWLENLKLLYDQQDFFKQSIKIEWNLFRLRPVNHPFIRIIQLSDFIYNSLKSTFFYDLLNLFSFPENKFSKKIFNQKLESIFRCRHEELPEHYQIGKERIKAILINIIIPIVLLYSEKMNYPKLGELCYRIFAETPGQINNRITNTMSQFLDNNKRKIARKSTIYQQGLLKLYFDYCRHHRCSACDLMMKKILKTST